MIAHFISIIIISVHFHFNCSRLSLSFLHYYSICLGHFHIMLHVFHFHSHDMSFDEFVARLDFPFLFLLFCCLGFAFVYFSIFLCLLMSLIIIIIIIIHDIYYPAYLYRSTLYAAPLAFTRIHTHAYQNNHAQEFKDNYCLQMTTVRVGKLF